MAYHRLLVALTVSLTLALACSEDDKVVSPASRPLILGDVINFDTSIPILVEVYEPNAFETREPFVNWEGHGEPFVDVDGDGVYTPWRDLFMLSATCDSVLDILYCRCDSVIDSVCIGGYRLMEHDTAHGWDFVVEYYRCNQDLNHNGVYDGPNDRWSPGVPFDDFDGDGEYDWEHLRYVPGLPYADLNGNGHYDSALGSRCGIEFYRFVSSDPWHRYGAIYISSKSEPYFRYVAASGREYEIDGPGNSVTSGLAQFLLDSTGFYYRHGNWHYPIFTRSEVTPLPSEEVKVTTISGNVHATRSTEFNHSLQMHGRDFNGLICVDFPRTYYGEDTLNLVDLAARFYFAPNTLHLMALRVETPQRDSVWVFLDRRLDTVPLPMVR